VVFMMIPSKVWMNFEPVSGGAVLLMGAATTLGA
jgi:hypothetical protein